MTVTFERRAAIKFRRGWGDTPRGGDSRVESPRGSAVVWATYPFRAASACRWLGGVRLARDSHTPLFLFWVVDEPPDERMVHPFARPVVRCARATASGLICSADKGERRARVALNQKSPRFQPERNCIAAS